MTTWQATDGKGKGKQSDARAKKKKWRKYVVNSEQSPPLWHTELFSRELCSNEVTQCDCKCTFQEVCMSFNLQVIQLYIFTCPVMNLWSGEMFLTINLSFYKQQDVCVYVYLYIYFYTYLSIHPSARPPTCVYIDIYTYTHTHTCIATGVLVLSVNDKTSAVLSYYRKQQETLQWNTTTGLQYLRC